MRKTSSEFFDSISTSPFLALGLRLASKSAELDTKCIALLVCASLA